MDRSLFADYISELTGGVRRAIEREYGFVHYQFPAWAQDCILIDDIYVKPEVRKAGWGRKLFEEIEELGRKAGKKAVIAQLDLTSEKRHESWAAHLAVGLVPITAEGGKILMRKVL